jgi:hypothetical protein
MSRLLKKISLKDSDYTFEVEGTSHDGKIKLILNDDITLKHEPIKEEKLKAFNFDENERCIAYYRWEARSIENLFNFLSQNEKEVMQINGEVNILESYRFRYNKDDELFNNVFDVIIEKFKEVCVDELVQKYGADNVVYKGNFVNPMLAKRYEDKIENTLGIKFYYNEVQRGLKEEFNIEIPGEDIISNFKNANNLYNNISALNKELESLNKIHKINIELENILNGKLYDVKELIEIINFLKTEAYYYTTKLPQEEWVNIINVIESSIQDGEKLDVIREKVKLSKVQYALQQLIECATTNDQSCYKNYLNLEALVERTLPQFFIEGVFYTNNPKENLPTIVYTNKNDEQVQITCTVLDINKAVSAAQLNLSTSSISEDSYIALLHKEYSIEKTDSNLTASRKTNKKLIKRYALTKNVDCHFSFTGNENDGKIELILNDDVELKHERIFSVEEGTAQLFDNETKNNRIIAFYQWYTEEEKNPFYFMEGEQENLIAISGAIEIMEPYRKKNNPEESIFNNVFSLLLEEFKEVCVDKLIDKYGKNGVVYKGQFINQNLRNVYKITLEDRTGIRLFDEIVKDRLQNDFNTELDSNIPNEESATDYDIIYLRDIMTRIMDMIMLNPETLQKLYKYKLSDMYLILTTLYDKLLTVFSDSERKTIETPVIINRLEDSLNENLDAESIVKNISRKIFYSA